MVSSCLLGHKVRYDGKGGRLHAKIAEELRDKVELVPFCPECSAGLTIPRPPAEIQKGCGYKVLRGDASVQTQKGQDVTDLFIAGANNALSVCQKERLDFAILKERSPSCGSSVIYNGTFSGQLISGVGVTTALLRDQGITVRSDEDVVNILDYLSKI